MMLGCLAVFLSVYSNGPAEIVDPLIYEGFVEELVEVLETKEKGLMVSERVM